MKEGGRQRNEQCVVCGRATLDLSSGGEISVAGLGSGTPFPEIHPAGGTLA